MNFCDYGIKPPEALSGLIVVKDNILVKFNLIIRHPDLSYAGSLGMDTKKPCI